MDAEKYPENWKEISLSVKKSVGWKCEVCGHKHEPKAGYTLVVHHLLPDHSINFRWNLIAVCIRCWSTLEWRSQVLGKALLQIYSLQPDVCLIEHLKGYVNFLRTGHL